MHLDSSRRMWTAALGIGLLIFGVSVTEASHLKESPNKHKIVYHLNDPGVDKAKAVLGNIRNHIKGVGDWETSRRSSWSFTARR